jgi:hypothetical protein
MTKLEQVVLDAFGGEPHTGINWQDQQGRFHTGWMPTSLFNEWVATQAPSNPPVLKVALEMQNALRVLAVGMRGTKGTIEFQKNDIVIVDDMAMRTQDMAEYLATGVTGDNWPLRAPNTPVPKVWVIKLAGSEQYATAIKWDAIGSATLCFDNYEMAHKYVASNTRRFSGSETITEVPECRINKPLAYTIICTVTAVSSSNDKGIEACDVFQSACNDEEQLQALYYSWLQQEMATGIIEGINNSELELEITILKTNEVPVI